MVRAVLATLCAALLALAGCHAPNGPPRPTPILQPVAPELPTTTRTAIEPDVSLLPTEPSAAPFKRPTEYRRLTADGTRRFAIANGPFADDLDRHPENDPPSHPKVQKNAIERSEVSRLVRGHAADELRNRAAGEALEQFFKLAEAEGQFDLLSGAETELRTQLADALKAETAGFKDRADIPTWRRRLLELEAQQAKLEAGIGAINASLRARLGLPGNDALPLWPADPLRVKPDDVDIERAVAIGLQYRPDLNLLRVLAEGNAGELTEGVLTGLNPLLGKLEPDNLLRLLFAPLMRD